MYIVSTILTMLTMFTMLMVSSTCLPILKMMRLRTRLMMKCCGDVSR